MDRSADHAIRLERVTKWYRKGLRRNVRAVNQIDVTIERGSVVALVGPNGAGKTTSIHMLLGLLKPDAGRIRVFGEPPDSLAARRRVGFVSEIFHTYRFHTARRALSFYATLSGRRPEGVESRIPALLERVGLAAVADRKVSTFSKGMNERLGLAQALLHQPDLLILDEPTTGLDPQGRRLVADVIAEEKARGTTVLLSSHILADVERSCDRVLMLRHGEIVHSQSLGNLGVAPEAWEIDVRGMADSLRRLLVSEGFEVTGQDVDVATIRCSPASKDRLLRRLLDESVEIERLGRGDSSLEDLYMHLVEARASDG